MTRLIERLAARPAEDACWLTGPQGVVEAGRLLRALSTIHAAPWQGRRVGVGALPVLEFAGALAFLDGLAEAIVLLPPEDDAPTRAARLADARLDGVLEGEGLGVARRLIDEGATFARPAPIDTSWLLPTSGTTGTPKLIGHTLASLTRSMGERRLGGAYTWGSLYSLRRFAGLQVLLQSWTNGTPLVLHEEGAGLQDVLAGFIARGVNALSATPSMWRKLAMHPLFGDLDLKQVTLGGEIVDQPVLDMLAARFPSARISHIYASTEAGVGFAVRDGRAGFPVGFLDEPPSGVALRIDAEHHLWFKTATGWIDSGDVVEPGAERVRFLGRANGSINVGGNKVMPEEIESVIKELPDIAFVQVRARRSALLGSLVEAAVTPVPGRVVDADFKKRVTAHCRSRLEAFKVPAFVVAADGIALTASGKLARATA